MNENIDLTKILKNCPKGTVLWSKIHGEVKLKYVVEYSCLYPIAVTYHLNNGEDYEVTFSPEGFIDVHYKGECLLVPSKDQQDWSKWKCHKLKFEPKTLKPFDKVLARVSDNDNCLWFADFVSTPASNNMLTTVIGEFGCDMVIPYNDDTKHLIGTTDEAPEYYRYWED